MFLSNPGKFLFLVIFCIVFFQACGGSTVNENKPVPFAADSKGEFPFSTKEPEMYQGDFVVATGQFEKKWFVARKGDRWRFETYRDGGPSFTRLKTDKLYLIDHIRRIYTEDKERLSGEAFFYDLKYNFFKAKEYFEFEELEAGDNLVKYKVRQTDHMNDEVLIFIDKASGMMVRQEFNGGGAAGRNYVFEIRNLKLVVDDSIFAIPEGYRKAAPNGLGN